jgi:hypothetical protein
MYIEVDPEVARAIEPLRTLGAHMLLALLRAALTVAALALLYCLWFAVAVR